MQGVTLDAGPRIVIPSAPPTYRKAITVTRPHPLLMFPAELRDLRELMRLTTKAMAALVGVSERGLVRWEAGERKPNRENAAALADLIAFTDSFVDELAEAHPAGSTITSCLVDDDVPAAATFRGERLPASWYRAAVGRASERTGARIDYAS